MSQDEGLAETPVDLKFFRNLITAMTGVLVLGFVTQLAMGRSSFNAPPVVHLHAVTFMGWAAITLTQAWLAASGNVRYHGLLGRLALAWAAVMVFVGPLVTAMALRTDRAPFFFQREHFLFADSGILVGFFVLLIAAVAMRRRTDWHVRLQVGAYMMLMGPGFGRLLPMPLLIPWSFDLTGLAGFIFIAAGAVQDLRKTGRVHPAWAAPVAMMIAVLGGAHLLAASPLGDALYQSATKGSPAEALGHQYPAPPHH